MTAPVFVASAKGSTTFSATSDPLALDVGSAAGRCVLVVASNNSSPSTTIVSATYGGVAMTAAAASSSGSSVNPYRGFYLFNVAATGSNNVVVTYGDGNSKPFVVAASFSGVDTSSGVSGGTNATGFSTTPSWSITSAIGDLGVVIADMDPGTGSNPAGGTGVTQDAFDRSGTELFDSFIWEKAGATSLTIDGTTGAPTPNWQGVAFSLKAISGGAANQLAWITA